MMIKVCLYLLTLVILDSERKMAVLMLVLQCL